MTNHDNLDESEISTFLEGLCEEYGLSLRSRVRLENLIRRCLFEDVCFNALADEVRDVVSFVARDGANEAIDTIVDTWHEMGPDIPLHQYLGMSESEYEEWILDPDAYPYGEGDG